MISTTNYVARKYGVRAAMPGFIGKKLCPDLIFVKSHYDKYEVAAEQIRSVIREYDPCFSSHSLDEVYMDLTVAAMERIRNPADSRLAPRSVVDAMNYVKIDDDNDSKNNKNDVYNQKNNIHENKVHDNDNNDDNNDNIGNYDSNDLKDKDVNNNNVYLTKNNDNENKVNPDISIKQLRVAACEVLQEIRLRVCSITGTFSPIPSPPPHLLSPYIYPLLSSLPLT